MLVQFYLVSKSYDGDIMALKDVSLKIDHGEFIFLMGASGAGKSTMIRMLIREILPDSGQIFINDRSLIRLKRREIPALRRNIGIVFQDFKLLENKSVYENIAFAMKVVGSGDAYIRARVPEVIELVGLKGREQARPHELSGGEQQRIGIARALANQPVLLIADEPTGNLDVETAQEIMQLLYQVNYLGTTVIMATHARELVRNAYRRVIMLENGSIIADLPNGEGL